MGRWNEEDNAKAISLWKKKKVNPEDLSVPTVKAVHQKYWTDKAYAVFAPRYREKARAYSAGLSLTGHRARAANAKEQRRKEQAEANKKEGEEDEDEDEEDEDYADVEGESIGSEDTQYQDTEEELEAEEEEDTKMPATKKTPPRPKKTPSRSSTPNKMKSPLKSPPVRKKVATTVDDIADMTKDLNIGEDAPKYSMAFTYPQVNYSYPVNGVDHLTIDFCTPAYHEDTFQPFIDDNQMACGLKTKVPAYFLTEKRFRRADRALAMNSTKTESYKDTLNDVEADNHFDADMWGDPQMVGLPYKVETTIVEWKLQYYPTKDPRVIDKLGAPQYFGVLSVTLRAFEKKTKKAVATSEVIEDSSDEEGDAAMGETANEDDY